MSLYLVIIIIVSLLALAIALPLTIGGARLLAMFFATMLNPDLTSLHIPWTVLAAQAVIGLLVPLAAAAAAA